VRRSQALWRTRQGEGRTASPWPTDSRTGKTRLFSMLLLYTCGTGARWDEG
jgi:hypothetical protein